MTDFQPYKTPQQAWANFKHWVALGLDMGDRNNGNWTLVPEFNITGPHSGDDGPEFDLWLPKGSHANGLADRWSITIPATDLPVPPTFQTVASLFIEQIGGSPHPS